METKNALCSWSGGKDSCFALMQSINQGFTPRVLLNVLNEEGKISRSHGIPLAILKAQADAMRLPLHAISSSWEEYEQHFTNALKQLKGQFELNHAIFGDIDLQAHRDWEEKVCTHSDLKAILPLWKQDRKELLSQMLSSGIETMIVSCNEKMGPKYLGRLMTVDLADKLEATGVDPCGENGEFHTLVLYSPLFSHRIAANISEKVNHGNYWFAKLDEQ